MTLIKRLASPNRFLFVFIQINFRLNLSELTLDNVSMRSSAVFDLNSFAIGYVGGLRMKFGHSFLNDRLAPTFAAHNFSLIQILDN